jgi:hypothetical protein
MALSRQKLLKEYVRNNTTRKSQLLNTMDAKQAGLMQ